MQRTLYFLPLLFLVPHAAQAQVPNGGFEDWTWTLGNDEPDEWITDNLMGLFFNTTFATEGTGIDGTSCIELTTRELPSLGLHPAVAYTGANAEGADGWPYTARPELLVGRLKYAPVANDMASIAVSLTRWDPVAGQRVVVGSGTHLVQTAVADWSLFELTITYLDPAAPDTAVITLTSSLAATSPGSVFSVDALDLSMGAAIGGPEVVLLGTWPNPVGTQLHVQAPMALRTLDVLDAAGRHLLSVDIRSHFVLLDVEALPSGAYHLRARSLDGQLLHGRFVKH